MSQESQVTKKLLVNVTQAKFAAQNLSTNLYLNTNNKEELQYSSLLLSLLHDAEGYALKLQEMIERRKANDNDLRFDRRK